MSLARACQRLQRDTQTSSTVAGVMKLQMRGYVSMLAEKERWGGFLNLFLTNQDEDSLDFYSEGIIRLYGPDEISHRPTVGPRASVFPPLHSCLAV